MFVMENMHNDMESFFKEHCLEVDADDETHSHKYYELFKEYCTLLESKLDVFVEEQGLTAKTLFKRLQAAQEENDMAAQIVQYLLGATDYERFVDLLLDRQLYFYGPYSDNPKPLHRKKMNDNDSGYDKKRVDEGKKSDENSNVDKTDRNILDGSKTSEAEDDDFGVKKSSKK